jgi:hypothetical protein
MYSPAFQTILADARVEDLRRARGTSIQPHHGREDRDPRATARFARLRRTGIRGLEVAGASSATWGPRS